jgi:alpha-beta hydrolase superfamily lysophospholipase
MVWVNMEEGTSTFQVVIDLRGHGRSTGTRTHVSSFEEYPRDLEIVWDQMGLGGTKPVLFGHSMGGLIAVRAVQSGVVAPAALVLSSPLLGLKMRVNPVKRLMGKMLVGLFPKTRFKNGLDPNNMTRDAGFARERREDPLIVRSVTASWFFAMQRAIALAHRDVAKITLPVLAFHGLADVTIDGDVLSSWLSKTNSAIHELISLPEHVHEVFHESDWQATALRMLEWLERFDTVHSDVSPTVR